jgi:hypothetical protein
MDYYFDLEAWQDLLRNARSYMKTVTNLDTLKKGPLFDMINDEEKEEYRIMLFAPGYGDQNKKEISIKNKKVDDIFKNGALEIIVPKLELEGFTIEENYFIMDVESDMDLDKLKATLKNGILMVTIPKKKGTVVDIKIE